MLLPLIALYYKVENDKKVKNYIRKLKNKNSELIEAIEMIGGAEDENLEDILEMQMYRPFSKEEFVLAFSECMFLYMPMNGFLDKLYEEVVY